MLSPWEVDRCRAMMARLEKEATDEITLDTALALWPHCEDTVSWVCNMDLTDAEVSDTAMRVRLVCERLVAAHEYKKLGWIIAHKAGKLSRECSKLQQEAFAAVMAER